MHLLLKVDIFFPSPFSPFRTFYVSFDNDLFCVTFFVTIDSSVILDLDCDLDCVDKPAIVVDKSSDYVFVDNVPLNNFLKAYDVKVHNMFHSKDSMMNIMHMITIQNNFEFDTLRSCKTRVYFRCVKDGCIWLFRACTLNDSCDIQKITCYVNTHSCLLDVRHN